MSPASQSKSKDKSEEAQKASANPAVNPAGTANAIAGIPSSVYNMLSRTFHTMEVVSASSSTSPTHSDSQSQNIDETDEHPGDSVVSSIEYGSVSNIGIWSGESKGHKEKASSTLVQPELVRGAYDDKREKNRQKNAKKHQCQKERRAQLHKSCISLQWLSYVNKTGGTFSTACGNGISS
ncbi:hypothetical protein RIF29_20377 [Crotalaria pallida]|uniref:Uncharacterized protein n=1 Tax=Crotalaria pallida TaxID=3830 RepID=A0AAN9I7F2_CROPI